MKTLIPVIVILWLVVSCTDKTSQSPSQVFGPSVNMGNGSVRTWLKLDANGNPASIGFTLSKDALDNLPTTLPETAFMLALPDVATTKTPFRHVMINWNPQGHPPDGIYTVPHFDFHFYIQPMAETMAIPLYTQAPDKFDKVPPTGSIPTDFVKSTGGIPAMGAHWLDMTSQEFKGSPFTETFIYGSYDGKVTFWEQMITMAYLKGKPTLDKAIKLPTTYATPGYYPTRYGVTTNADGSLDISMDVLTQR